MKHPRRVDYQNDVIPVKTKGNNIEQNGTINGKGSICFLVGNQGTTNCNLILEDGGIKKLNPGSQPISFGGKPNQRRFDKIKVEFAGGVGDLIVIYEFIDETKFDWIFRENNL